jgi:methionine synthase I (cobalamin-dependent)
VSLSHPLLSRLDTGRPLLVSGDPAASFRARGLPIHGPAALGRLLREHPGAVRDHYHQDIAAGVDVMACLTADTLPRALQQIGMPFRSAALTGDAVELALEAADQAPRPVIVAGMLGNADVPPVSEDRVSEEMATHAARLAAAGCELILARGFTADPHDAAFARLARRAAVVSGVMTQLPTWALAAVDADGYTADGATIDETARRAFDEGAQVALFEIPTASLALQLANGGGLVRGARHVGFALAAGALDPEAWAHEARRLIEAGVRILGGGPGTTHRHIAALSGLLRGHERQSLWPRAVG